MFLLCGHKAWSDQEVLTKREESQAEAAELRCGGKGCFGGGSSECGSPEAGMNVAQLRNEKKDVWSISCWQMCGEIARQGFAGCAEPLGWYKELNFI